MFMAARHPRVGIVSTVRDTRRVLDSFVRYHHALGFSHFWLFFDDPNDSNVDVIAALPGVHAFRHDAQLRERWMQSRLDMLPFVDTEVMARQALNAEIALELAQGAGVDFLLHIDSDELFWPLEPFTQHFAGLLEASAEVVSYHNVEVLPQSPDCECMFREQTLFKKGPGLQVQGLYSKLQQDCLADVPQFREQFFLSYLNGKSAARVGVGLEPELVHSFCRRDARARWVVGRGLVLHYVNATFERFWAKYRALGSFSDQWFGHMEISATVGNFHTQARDVVAHNDVARARRFYDERVCLGDHDVVERLLAADLLAQIDGPQRLLSGLRE